MYAIHKCLCYVFSINKEFYIRSLDRRLSSLAPCTQMYGDKGPDVKEKERNSIDSYIRIYEERSAEYIRIHESIVKVKVHVYSLISNLKTYHPTLHLTTLSLDLFIRVPFQLNGEHTVLQPFRRIELIVHIVISVLPGTHFHLSQVKHLRVKCLAQGHNILTMSQGWEGRNMIFLWKFCTKRDSKPHGSQRHRQSATL